MICHLLISQHLITSHDFVHHRWGWLLSPLRNGCIYYAQVGRRTTQKLLQQPMHVSCPTNPILEVNCPLSYFAAFPSLERIRLISLGWKETVLLRLIFGRLSAWKMTLIVHTLLPILSDSVLFTTFVEAIQMSLRSQLHSPKGPTEQCTTSWTFSTVALSPRVQ